MSRSLILLLGWGVCVSGAFAQSSGKQPVLAGAGYSFPVPLSVAPGQIITLFVESVDTQLTAPVRATGTPLPSSLGGVSVTYRQGSDRPALILEVKPESTCFGVPPSIGACATILAVTAQMPFEMLTVCPVCGRLDIPAAIVATVNGVTTPFVAVQPVPDQVHFVNSCDVLSPASQPRVFAMSGACSPMVTHADGKLVTAANPATPGEEVAAYAVGLGQTDPPMTQGQPAPDAAPTVHQFAIDFNYHANALATKPAGPSFFGGPVTYAAPLFTGATAGMVGLYQVNFVVPAAPANLTGCSDTGNAFPFTNVIQSNLTVSIGSLFSFDGVAICVAR